MFPASMTSFRPAISRPMRFRILSGQLGYVRDIEIQRPDDGGRGAAAGRDSRK
jgi:hypothetical protein